MDNKGETKLKIDIIFLFCILALLVYFVVGQPPPPPCGDACSYGTNDCSSITQAYCSCYYVVSTDFKCYWNSGCYASTTDSCNPCIDSDYDSYDSCDSNGDPILNCGSPCDCDDTNSYVNPSIEEQCGNNIDDDCDGDIDENTCGCNPNQISLSPASTLNKPGGVAGW